MTIARISSYYILNDVFHIRFMLDGDMQLTTDNDKISLKYRSIDKDYSYPMKYKVKDKSIHAWIKLSDVEWKQQDWDIVADGIKFVYEGKLSKFASCLLFFNDYYKTKNGHIVCTSINVDKSISLQYIRNIQYRGFGFKLKERVALVSAAIYSLVKKKKPIIVIYEKFSKTAQDNGYYLFKYCMDNDIENRYNCRIFYSIDKNSPDYGKLIDYKQNVLDFMSLRYLRIVLNARLLVSTDSKAHAYPTPFYGGFLQSFIRKRPLIFLQHGVTAFKKVDFLYGKNAYGSCDRFVVTSDFEHDIVRDNFGYNEDEIAVTGFARWDVIEDKTAGKIEILVCPTWRKWLEDMEADMFMESRFYKEYTEFLNSEELAELLEENDITLNFYLHSKFKEYIGDFKLKTDKIKLIPFGSVALNELIMSSKLLITDYSSVAWDAYYIDHPVIFFQFDSEDYLREHGSYIDFDTELFGDRITDGGANALVDSIRRHVESDFELSALARCHRDMYFKYRDKDNCKRIVEIMGEFLN